MTIYFPKTKKYSFWEVKHCDISLALEREVLKDALVVLEEHKEANSRVNINMISTSEIRITVLVDEKDIDKAVNAVHDGFALTE